MIRDALQYLAELGKKTGDIRTLDMPGHDLLVVTPDGTAAQYTKPSPARTHQLDSLEAFRDVMLSMSISNEATVWHDEEVVRGLLGDQYREDQITLPLVKSEQFESLERAQHSWLDQRQLVETLRSTWRGVMPDPLLPMVRRVEFKRTSDGGRSLEHGKESLGKGVEAEVSALGEIPEYVQATCLVYQTAGVIFRCQVECCLTVDVDNQRFMIAPIPGKIEEAITAAAAWIGETLRSELDGIEVFAGRP